LNAYVALAPGIVTVIVGFFLSTLLPPIEAAVEQLPTASQTLRVVVDADVVSVPSGTLVVSEKLASAADARPDPPSLAEQLTATSLACQAASDATQEIVGAFLSTLLPVTGPADAQLPTASHTLRLAVDADAVSVPAATLVESEKLASEGNLRPEPPSLAVQATATSSW